LERTQDPFSDVRGDRLKSGDEVSQKARGVVVPLVQRQPGGRSPATGYPFAKQGGFAEACGGGDEGQSAVQALVKTLVEALDQAGAEDGLRPGWGGVEFRG
jgi:hypothetical protein